MHTKQQDGVRDAEFAARIAKETQERERAAALEQERREARRKEAERLVPENLAYAVIAPTRARQEDLETLCASKSEAFKKELIEPLVTTEQEIARIEAKRDAEASHRRSLSPYALGKYAEMLQPLYEQQAELWKLREACHDVAKERIGKAVDAIISEQIRLRDQFIAKAVPFDERIGLMEQTKSYFAVPVYGTQKRNLKRWVQGEQG